MVLNQLGEHTAQALSYFDGRLKAINAADVGAWTLAHQADVLVTAPRSGWRGAPRLAPPGWPGRLKWVHTASVGIDFYPEWLFEVPQVTCARGVAAVPIAEYVLWALLEQAKQLNTRSVANAEQWRAEFDRASTQPMGLLHGQTLGLVGYGAIGREVAQRAQAFGMRVIALRRSPGVIQDPGVQTERSLHHLIASVDHLVLALPITADTHHLIDALALEHARPGLHLINIARGQLVDHDALLAALDAGRIAAATLDVTDPEPLPAGHALYRHPRVRLTPHISWSAGDVTGLGTRKFLDNLKRYLDGHPLHDVVDRVRGY